MDDILIPSPAKELSHHNTVNALSQLAERWCKVSKEKAQISLQQVEYLGFIIEKGHRTLSTERIDLPDVTPSYEKTAPRFPGEGCALLRMDPRLWINC